VSASPRAVYLDSSALVKLVVPEPESQALRTELRRWDRFVSSSVVRVEAVRACARVDERARSVAEAAVRALDLLAVDDELLEAAARVEPASLRSLDAIHVASATLVADALGAVLVYDERLSAAMEAVGLPVAAPR
jgi:uncharacterized protein